jgi:hypothetical protein
MERLIVFFLGFAIYFGQHYMETIIGIEKIFGAFMC